MADLHYPSNMLPMRVLAGTTAANGLTIYPSMENEVTANDSHLTVWRLHRI